MCFIGYKLNVYKDKLNLGFSFYDIQNSAFVTIHLHFIGYANRAKSQEPRIKIKRKTEAIRPAPQ